MESILSYCIGKLQTTSVLTFLSLRRGCWRRRDVTHRLQLVWWIHEYVGVHKQNYLMHFLQTALNCERTRFAITFNRNAIRQLGMLWPLDRCRDPHRHSCRTQLNRIFSHQRRFQMPDQSVWERTLCYKSEQCVPLHKWFNGLDMLVGLSNNKKIWNIRPRIISETVSFTSSQHCHNVLWVMPRDKQTKHTKLKMETEWLMCHFFLV